jgi:uncharacterized protein
MLRIVIDTNVIISAFLHKKFSGLVYEDCVTHHLVFTSQWILDEVDRTLSGKFSIPDVERSRIIDSIIGRSIVITPTTKLPNICTDIDDNNVLQVCDSVHADVLISGDRALVELKSFNYCKILTPRMYFDSIIGTTR